MSTSLKVVSMAAVFWASLRRRAMVARRRVIFTRSSRAASSGGDGARTCTAAAGCATGMGWAAARSIAASMSPFVTRPSRPEPGTVVVSMPLSAASLRTEGASGTSAGAIRGETGAAGGSALGVMSSGPAPMGFVVEVFSPGLPVGLAVAVPPAAPSAIWPSNAPTATVSPSLAAMSASTPAAGDGTSIVTLSVSSSTSGSSTATASPACLNQRPIVASITDSPRVGTRMSAMSCSSIQGVVEKRLELCEMLGHHAGGGRRGRRPADIARPALLGVGAGEGEFEIRLDEVPAAHVARLLLTPHHLGVLEAGQLLGQHLGGKRIELLDAHQIDVVDAVLLALLVEVVIDLAGAQDDAADLVVGDEADGVVARLLRIVPQQPVEGGVGRELVKARDRALVAQQALRRHQDQRLADVALELAPQHMEIVGRRRAVRHLHVVLGTHLQEALEPGRRMLRSLALEAVRQKADEARHAQPLAFARRDELVEHDLGPVGEVAELRLPQRQRVRLRQGVAVFEAKHCLLGQHRVDDLEPRLVVGEVVERDVALLGVLVDQHRMALREGAAFTVLAREAHREAFGEQRGESERLGGGPVDTLPGLDRLGAALKEALDRPVHMEALGHRGDLAADFLQSVG